MKNITIEVPDNCKLIKEDDTTFKVITEREPKTWKEFCDIVPVINEYYIDQFSNVRSISSGKRDPMYDRTLCATREEAEAIVALIQLRRLKVEWDKYEKNICSKGTFKYYVIWDYGNSCLTIGEGLSKHLLEFNSRDSASEFITCFSYLLEKAKLFLH